jgi:hypothetical protein
MDLKRTASSSSRHYPPPPRPACTQHP